jgi:hypothetical protein
MLALVTKWNESLGFDTTERPYLNLMKTKWFVLFFVNPSFLLHSKSNKLMIAKRVYEYKERCFIVPNNGFVILQKQFRVFLKKKKIFQNIRRYILIQELQEYFLSPPNETSDLQIYQKGGILYREALQSFYNF